MGAALPPFSPSFIRFNNLLNETKFDPALVQLTPAVPDLTVEAIGSTINLRGATKGRTTYTVTLSPEIEDVFGQKLGKSQTLTLEIGSAERYLTGPTKWFGHAGPVVHQAGFYGLHD